MSEGEKLPLAPHRVRRQPALRAEEELERRPQDQALPLVLARDEVPRQERHLLRARVHAGPRRRSTKKYVERRLPPGRGRASPRSRAGEDGLVVTRRRRGGRPVPRRQGRRAGRRRRSTSPRCASGLELKQGEVFNRSSLTADVEDLERYYTDRGFFYASVSPRTTLNEDDEAVDVDLRRAEGRAPLHPRDRRHRQHDHAGPRGAPRDAGGRGPALLGARGEPPSSDRVKRLGFFEDVEFEPKATDYQEQLDLDVKVVERPTGSLSFGVGFSSAGRPRGLRRLSAVEPVRARLRRRIGGRLRRRNSRFYLSFSDPYVFGSECSLRTTLSAPTSSTSTSSRTRSGVEFVARPRPERGGHRARLPPLRLRHARRDRAAQHDRERRPAMILPRAPLRATNSTSLFGVSASRHARRPRRADRRPRLRREPRVRRASAASRSSCASRAAPLLLRHARLAPDWFPFRDDVELRLSARARATRCRSTTSPTTPFDVPPLAPVTGESEVQPLDNIDTDLELPLSERYFLGGLGSFQLRGYRARSVGPRRALLQRTGAFGTGDALHAGGPQVAFGEATAARARRLLRRPADASATRATATASATASSTRTSTTSTTSTRRT